MIQLHPDDNFDQVMVSLPDGEELILVRVGNAVRAYRNSCPHLGIGLDYGDGRCLDADGKLICAMHGARFEPADGYCIDGPCRGDSLEAVAIVIRDGAVLLA